MLLSHLNVVVVIARYVAVVFVLVEEVVDVPELVVDEVGNISSGRNEYTTKYCTPNLLLAAKVDGNEFACTGLACGGKLCRFGYFGTVYIGTHTPRV